MNQSTIGASNQMTQFAIVMFGSIVSSVAASTVIIMSLLGGPLAGALTTQNNSTQTGASADMCIMAPADAADETDVTPAKVEATGGSSYSGLPFAVTSRGYLTGSVSGSFNTTNNNTTTTHTTNTFTNTETRTIVTIRDNGNSYSASWNNGNTAVYAPTTNTSTVTNTSQNNGNTNNQNNGNDNSTVVNDNDGVDLL
jgi:hypothetical protein